MKKLGKLVGLLVLLITIPALARVPTIDDPEAFQGLSPEQIQAVKAGEVVILHKDQDSKGDTQRFIQSAILFNQPIDVVWQLLHQTEKQDEYLPRLYKCELVERQANWDKIDFFIKVLFVNIDYRVKHNFDDENYYMFWALDPDYPNDLKHLEGYYRLYKVDENHTLARYGTIFVLSGLIPKSIQEILTRQDLPVSLDAVKKRIDSNGAYTKPDFKKKK